MLDQLPLLSGLSPTIRELVMRVLALAVALAIIFLARRVLAVALLIPIKRLTGRSGIAAPEHLLEIVLGPVRLVLIAAALTVSAQILIPKDTFFRGFIDATARTLIILAVLSVVYRLIDLLLPTGTHLASLTGIRVEERLVPFMRVGIKVFVLAIGIVIITQELGYDVSGLIAGIGVGGLAISLAAQDTIANLFGFVSIVGDSPFSIGDSIKTPDAEGTVEHVGLRSTRLRQPDQTLITVPNNILANSAIANQSRMMKRRVDIMLRLDYGTTSAQMREFLKQSRDLLRQWPSVEPGSEQIFFSKFTEHALEIIVRCYVRKQSWAEMMAEQENIQLRLMDILGEMGLELAAPPPSAPKEN